MSRARYLELLRGLLLEVGVPRDRALVAGYNRLRRFLPTLGNCLQFDPIDLQAIGNWTDIPDAGGATPTYKPKRASMPMGLHYAGQKVARSAQIKQHALTCFFKLWKRKQPELALNHDGLVTPDSWSWQEVCATSATIQLPAVADLPPNPEQDEGAIEVAPGALADIEGKPDQVEAEESDISDYDGVSSSTSPSASDESAVGEELVGIIPPDDIATSLAWFQQGAKVHVLRTDNLQAAASHGAGNHPSTRILTGGRGCGHDGEGDDLPEVPQPHAALPLHGPGGRMWLASLTESRAVLGHCSCAAAHARPFWYERLHGVPECFPSVCPLLPCILGH